MNRRTVATLVAVALIAVLGVIALSRPVPWVRYRPALTIDVLNEFEGKETIVVTGRKTYRDDGQLRLVTVRPDGPQTKVNMVSIMIGWADRDVSIYPRSIYAKTATNDSVRDESAAEMSSSQDLATAAALSALGIGYRTDLVVAEVAKDGAAAKLLKKGDVIRAIDGKTDADPDVLVNRIREGEPGRTITLTVLRNGKVSTIRIKTRPAPEDPTSARIGIAPGSKYAFPFKVKIQLPGTIGGPSAGMIFALALYDILSPGSLTDGKVIAGTGTISGEGVVGPIGGIGQKIPSAQRDGAELFLVPQENCGEALRAHHDPEKLRLVKIHTLDDAIKAVTTWSKNPDADLPRCTA